MLLLQSLIFAGVVTCTWCAVVFHDCFPPYLEVTDNGGFCCNSSQCQVQNSVCSSDHTCECLPNYVDLHDGICHPKVGLYQPCVADAMCRPAFSVCDMAGFCVCRRGYINTSGMCIAAHWNITMTVIMVAIIVLLVALMVALTARWRLSRLQRRMRQTHLLRRRRVERPADAPPAFNDIPRLPADPPDYDSIFVTASSATVPKIPTYEEIVRGSNNVEGRANEGFTGESNGAGVPNVTRSER